MINHVVMFQFAPEYQKDLQEAKRQLEALTSQIPELLSMQVGLNFLPGQRAMDLVLTAQVKNEADLEAYRVHPAHEAVAQYIKARSILSKSVDYR